MLSRKMKLWVAILCGAAIIGAVMVMTTPRGRGCGDCDDYHRDLRKYRFSAYLGNADAQFRIGRSALLIESNWKEAIIRLRKAADQSHAGAQYYLGIAYHEGRGVEKNEKEAVEWWLKAAEQGYSDAYIHAGIAYYEGKVVPKNNNEATYWLKKADPGRNGVAKRYLQAIEDEQ